MMHGKPLQLFRHALAATVLSVTAASTGASPIGTVRFELANSPFSAGSDDVKVEFNDGSFRRAVTVRAGMFGATATDNDGPDGGFDPSTLYRSENDVLLYCIDLLDNLIKAPTSYNVYNLEQDQIVGASQSGPRRDFARMFSFLGAVNSEMTTRGFTFGDKNWLEPSYGWMSAAIQVGIWESLYEDASAALALEDGWFTAKAGGSNTSTNIDPLGAVFLNDVFLAVGTANALDASQIKRFAPRNANGEIDGQELIGDPVVDVPTPAPLLLLMTGLGLLIRRKGVKALKQAGDEV